MLHMNPREDGITFTHDSVAGFMPRAHRYEHIDATISSTARTHNRAGMLHKRTRVKPRFLRAWYANPRSWNVEVPSDYTSDSHMRAISLKSSNEIEMTYRWLFENWTEKKEKKKKRSWENIRRGGN